MADLKIGNDMIFKTPRRSVRLKAHEDTPINVTSVAEGISVRRSTRKQKFDLSVNMNASTSEKPSSNRKKKNQSVSKNISNEEIAKNTNLNKKKKKQKKNKKSRKAYKSTGSSVLPSDSSEETLFNATFDKETSSGTDTGEWDVTNVTLRRGNNSIRELDSLNIQNNENSLITSDEDEENSLTQSDKKEGFLAKIRNSLSNLINVKNSDELKVKSDDSEASPEKGNSHNVSSFNNTEINEKSDRNNLVENELNSSKEQASLNKSSVGKDSDLSKVHTNKGEMNVVNENTSSIESNIDTSNILNIPKFSTNQISFRKSAKVTPEQKVNTPKTGKGLQTESARKSKTAKKSPLIEESAENQNENIEENLKKDLKENRKHDHSKDEQNYIDNSLTNEINVVSKEVDVQNIPDFPKVHNNDGEILVCSASIGNENSNSTEMNVDSVAIFNTPKLSTNQINIRKSINLTPIITSNTPKILKRHQIGNARKSTKKTPSIEKSAEKLKEELKGNDSSKGEDNEFEKSLANETSDALKEEDKNLLKRQTSLGTSAEIFSSKVSETDENNITNKLNNKSVDLSEEVKTLPNTPSGKFSNTGKSKSLKRQSHILEMSFENDSKGSSTTSDILPDNLKQNENLQNNETIEQKDIETVLNETFDTPKTSFIMKSTHHPTPNLKSVKTPRSIKRLQSDDKRSSTPIIKSSATRVSTPYNRNRIVEKKSGEFLKTLNSSLAEVILKSNMITPVNAENIIDLTSTKGKPSIRKRSLSESVKNKKLNRVTFHSPANHEISIQAVDEIMKSAKKQGSDKVEIDITQRRKRSLSVAETKEEKKAIFEEKIKDGQGQTSTKLMKSSFGTFSRTKMPNFSAIHQQKFHQMESIDEHLERKAERAKQLSASTGKAAAIGGSTTKPLQPKNEVVKESYRPKARQKINVEKTEIVDKNLTATKKLNSREMMPNPEIKTEKTKTRQRMDLYKSRPKVDNQSKRQEIIRGVRSNRRFELQMMCRNRSDQ